MSSEFNFEYWNNLYKTDPIAFDNERRRVLEESIIASSKDEKKQQRLRALLNGVEMKLSKFKNPQSRLAKMESLFAEQLFKFQQALKGNLEVDSAEPTNVVEIKKKE